MGLLNLLPLPMLVGGSIAMIGKTLYLLSAVGGGHMKLWFALTTPPAVGQ